MAPLLEDPRFRQTWNQISQNAESATENAAAGIWTFQHSYINPCFASLALGFEQCTGRCLGDREERARRLRERSHTRGRAELSFDFYDDWEDDDRGASGGLLGGWGNDELDRLLAGSGSHSGHDGDTAPRRKRGMSYGTRGRRKSLEPDPTVIPSTNTIGFLGRLPFKLGGTLRYKPSAADLQEHPRAGKSEFADEEGEPLMDDHDEHSGDERTMRKGHTRNRSSTVSSGETSDSFRSRGDLFPSDGEDDAVPLSDEFAMVLERRMTNTGTDDKSSGMTKSSKGKRPAGSRTTSRNLSRTTQSSHSRPSIAGHRASSGASIPQTTGIASPNMVETPSLTDLQAEEERIRVEEDAEVKRKRQAATRLALERGLHVEEQGTDESAVATKREPPAFDNMEEPSELPDNEGLLAKPLPPLPPAASEGHVDTSSSAFVPARLPHFG
ncbi:hypothetical protein D0Z07_8916 [Hyphodiscus hymeniophilus]|uniref:Uncharacterized protein n=1 Tax=Hyphodiscus hymeniophilus TaxID=353542 RepID=A0A9P6VD75_9HELO|nr:hypothetical protein D0Z07_8916 [Hyphodiscus hymeniophilus]